tara:strand:- start:1803 stop:2918 length:1116 start_codon:yes stop_codon:yes gene_type:complete
MKRKSRICQFLPNLYGGGAERVAVNLANEWNRKGHQVELILMEKKGQLLNDVSKDIRITSLDCNKIRNVFLELAKHLKKNNYDFIVIHMWPLTSISILSWLIARRKGRIILCEHVCLSSHIKKDLDVPYLIAKLIIKITHGLADGVVTVSKGVASDLYSLSKIKKNKIKVIYNPIVKIEELTIENNEKINREILWGGYYDYYLINVATLKKQKNIIMLINSIKEISSKLNLCLVIFGDGPEKEKLNKLINNYNLNQNVKLLGFKKDVSPWLESADLFVLSSDFEGFANVIVESLSYGTPVVSTDCKYGPAEIINKSNLGILSPVGDYKKFSQNIEKGLKNNWSTKTLKSRAKEFSIPIKSEEYLDFFKSLD